MNNFRIRLFSAMSNSLKISRMLVELTFSFLPEIRVPYRKHGDNFDILNLKFKHPLKQFREWFEEAVNSGLVYEANAMALSTCTRSGTPSVRVVLLKELDERGFHFFTNYESRKASELDDNPQASVLFYWEPLQRQVRVEGTVSRLSETESEAYFETRPKLSQMAAAISPQSQVIPNRAYLDEKLEELKVKYANQDKIPKPSNWGGYVLSPVSMEFWQGQSSRLHDRIRFRRLNRDEPVPVDALMGEEDWIYERLAP